MDLISLLAGLAAGTILCLVIQYFRNRKRNPKGKGKIPVHQDKPGGVVSVPMPEFITCPDCKGEGIAEVKDLGWSCKTCRGSGEIMRL